MALFAQRDFSGGLNAQLDAAKAPDNSYPLLLHGRTRRNTIAPTNRHVFLELAPQGNYQGLYITGSFILVFVSGLAYFGDVTQDPIIFVPVGGWTPMDADVSRIYAEPVPATANLFSLSGTPDNMSRTFNKALAIFQQGIFCFDGKNVPQAVLPDGTAIPLGSYDTWTQDNPLYVPIGVLPAFASNKLFVVSPDLVRVLQSVSGRASDFVVNLDNNGDKGGDVDTVSQTVSFNGITAVRAISTGEVLVGTLYGTFVLQLDYTNTIFGEPYLLPVFLFPAGIVNEISIVDVLSDTAFITQSGIHAFNAVMQAKRESNNFPFGAPIRGLITNPITEKAIIQDGTCAGLYDDYAFFAMNTIHGYGCLVFDTTTQQFQALDLSFGRVKQFAATRINGSERFFFITHDNKIYEAFADTQKNATRMLFGEWTPDEAPANVVAYMCDIIFTNVRQSGQVKVSFYTDRKFRYSAVIDVTSESPAINLPVPFPFPEGQQVKDVGFHFSHVRAWKVSATVEWNFAAELTDFSIDGKIETADNTRLSVQAINNPDISSQEKFAFIADSGYSDELCPGGVFDANGFVVVPVVSRLRYAYYPNGATGLADGSMVLTEPGTFVASNDHVTVTGVPGNPVVFSLRTAENYLSVLDAINQEAPSGIIHGGDFAYPSGTEIDVRLAKLPVLQNLYPVCGNHDVTTDSGKYFFNLLQVPRHYTKAFTFVDFFFFDAESVEIDGFDATSNQAGLVKNWLAGSNKPFKILVVHQPPYTNDVAHHPGRADLIYLTQLPGLSAILSGHGHVMERFTTNGFPSFVCGAGGAPLRSFVPGTSSAFRDSSHYGYILLTADALTCKVEFKDTDGNILDTYSLYA